MLTISGKLFFSSNLDSWGEFNHVVMSFLESCLSNNRRDVFCSLFGDRDFKSTLPTLSSSLPYLFFCIASLTLWRYLGVLTNSSYSSLVSLILLSCFIKFDLVQIFFGESFILSSFFVLNLPNLRSEPLL